MPLSVIIRAIRKADVKAHIRGLYEVEDFQMKLEIMTDMIEKKMCQVVESSMREEAQSHPKMTVVEFLDHCFRRAG